MMSSAADRSEVVVDERTLFSSCSSELYSACIFCVCRRHTPALTVQYVQLSLSSPVVDQLRRFSNR